MTDKEIITKLKDKDDPHPFGTCSDEEQVIFRKATPKNCLIFSGNGWWNEPVQDFQLDFTYVISPDWEPEPEYDDRPVYISSRGFCVIDIPDIGPPFNVIYAAGHKDFEEYFYLNKMYKMYCVVPPHKVSSHMADGKTVFGRFRRS